MAGRVDVAALRTELARLEQEEKEYCARTGSAPLDPEEVEDEDALIAQVRPLHVRRSEH